MAEYYFVKALIQFIWVSFPKEKKDMLTIGLERFLCSQYCLVLKWYFFVDVRARCIGFDRP